MASHVVPLRLPVSQRSASAKSQAPAFDRTYDVMLFAIAAMPMPTRMSRVPATPSLNAST